MNNFRKKINELAAIMKLNAFLNIDQNYEVTENVEEIIYEILKNQYEMNMIKSESRRIKRAGFKQLKTFDTFEFNQERLPNLDFENVKRIATCEFINDHENIIIIGPPGFGKTHLSTAIGIEAAKKGYRVIYKTASQLTTEMYEKASEKKLLSFIRYLGRVDFLILDDMGYAQYDQKMQTALFDLINARNEVKSTCFISNVNITEWIKFMPDKNLLSAMLDRIIYHATVFNMINDDQSQSYRRKNTKIFKKKGKNGLKK
ncbi:MAG: ATP-binding protein [Bacteroidales bacterium]|jgi:DNA replication protein DnaC|nr:ATP-binding protein [Bacteroidales bacterium]